MQPEASLLFAIFKQIIIDYIKLDPDGDAVSADYYESEHEDFQVAESIIFYKQPIYYGSLELAFDDLCGLFSYMTGKTAKQMKRDISQAAINY